MSARPLSRRERLGIAALAVTVSAVAALLIVWPLDQQPSQRHPVEDAGHRLVPVAFETIPGWTEDRHGEALAALHRSCSGASGRQDLLAPLCAAAAAIPAEDDAGARGLFERMVRPYRI